MIDNDNRIQCFPRNLMLLFLLKSINFVIFYKSYRGTGYKIIIVNLSFGKESEKDRDVLIYSRISFLSAFTADVIRDRSLDRAIPLISRDSF